MQSRYQALVSQVKNTIREIDPQETAKLDVNNYIIDVREISEWEKGHVPHAVHMSRGILEGNIERLVPDTSSRIVLYCAGGSRSALAAESLQRMGYTNVFSMQGGFGNWVQHGLPVSDE